jgi:predicted ATPase
MESLTKRRLPMIAVWDDEHVKALLHLPRFPIRLIHQEPWQSWIGQRGGVKSIHNYLQKYPLPPTQRRILDVVLSNPESVADVYANRLNISRATYFYQLRELVPAIAQALNHWQLHPSNPEIDLPLQPNLPAPLTSLVGVETILQTLTRLLIRAEVRLLTLLGPGGIGKTRLSVEIGRRMACEVYFVDLSAIRDAAKVAGIISQNLGIKEKTVSALKYALRDRKILLILDNFEQILAARILVTGLLGALPQLKVIVTSRIALHIYGEHEFIVPPLAITDIESVKGQQLWAQSPAVALFAQRAQAVCSSFSLNNENVEIITELCQRLDGLPLAIELAAYQIKYFSPKAMLACLSGNRLDFLSQASQRMPTHQETIRAMLDWSFNLLSPELQACLCQLSVFSRQFTLSEAKTICSLKNVQAGLIMLVDQSLLEQQPCVDDEPCFKMMSMVREYALAKRRGRALVDDG